MDNQRVIIIGGGPAGMALALNLAALGVRSVLINRETGPRWHPKGSTQNARTMEHYRRLGIVEKVAVAIAVEGNLVGQFAIAVFIDDRRGRDPRPGARRGRVARRQERPPAAASLPAA